MSELRVSPDQARRCAAACQKFIDDLDELHGWVSRQGSLSGFGSLPSGLALAKKYTDLTHGPEGSLAAMLDGHVTAAMKLREAFLAAGRGYEATEVESARRIRGAVR